MKNEYDGIMSFKNRKVGRGSDSEAPELENGPSLFSFRKHVRQDCGQVDEVEVFGLFGGDLPVIILTAS